MPLHFNLAINFSVVWLNWHNLFAFFGFSHLYLLSGQVAPILKMLHALKLVFMATYKANRRATVPILCGYIRVVNQFNRVSGYEMCGRIGIWTSLDATPFPLLFWDFLLSLCQVQLMLGGLWWRKSEVQKCQD